MHPVPRAKQGLRKAKYKQLVYANSGHRHVPQGAYQANARSSLSQPLMVRKASNAEQLPLGQRELHSGAKQSAFLAVCIEHVTHDRDPSLIASHVGHGGTP